MKIGNSRRAQRNGVFPSALKGCRPRKRQTRLTILACLGMLLSSLTLRADASIAIYLYAANGRPVDVTASYSYQQHYVYDSLNNRVGTVDDNGQIFNPAGQQIGHIVTISNNISAL